MVEDSPRETKPYCFVIMSFAENPSLQDHYEEAIKPTVEAFGFQCLRADEIEHNEQITSTIIDRIQNAHFIIADLTDERPNCYYELGFAHALGKNVIHTINKTTSIHFDIRDFNFIAYSRLPELRERLRSRIQATVFEPQTRNDTATVPLLTSFSDEIQNELVAKLKDSAEILILGITLGEILRRHYDLLEEKLRQGNTLKAILVNPDSPACAISVRRDYLPTKEEVLRTKIEAALTQLADLKKATSGKLEIRVLGDPLIYGGIIIDPDSANGVLYLWYYNFKMGGPPQPRIILRPSDTYWYERFKKEANAIWHSGTPWRHSQGGG